MIPIELAQKLKKAGLKWKPQHGDLYTYEPQTVRTFARSAGNSPVITIYSDCYSLNNPCAVRRCDLLKPSHFLWLPRLEQIVAEIEARGWTAMLKEVEKEEGKEAGERAAEVFRSSVPAEAGKAEDEKEKAFCCVITEKGKAGEKEPLAAPTRPECIFYGTVPEEAAGQALLWLLENKDKSPVERVRRWLAQFPFEIEVREFAASTSTAEEAARAVGVEVGQIAKSVLFTVNGMTVMVVASGDVKISPSRLKQHLKVSGKVKLADAATITEVTGFSPGGVCPFALPRPVRILIDESMRRFPVVYIAAGSPHSAAPVTVEQLLAITGGELCRVSEIAFEEERSV